MRIKMKIGPTGKPAAHRIWLRPSNRCEGSAAHDRRYAPIMPGDVVDVPDDLKIDSNQFEITREPVNRPWKFYTLAQVDAVMLPRYPSPEQLQEAKQARSAALAEYLREQEALAKSKQAPPPSKSSSSSKRS